MEVGLLKEVKTHEYRVGLTPEGVNSLVALGATVYVETNAGMGVGFTDDMYALNGAKVVDRSDVYEKATLLIKVKEPQPQEYDYFQSHHVLFTYLHLAADKPLADMLLARKMTAIAYETVCFSDGRLPLLTPMSQVAGRMSIQAGAHSLEKESGGLGVLLPGVPGTLPAEVMIIGAGVVGANALQMAVGMGASVTIFDNQIEKLEQIDAHYKGRVKTCFSTRTHLEKAFEHADLIVGAVLVVGDSAPKLIDKGDLALMKGGAVLVDVAIDQGGISTTSRPTTHDKPTYIVDGIVHYCVSNMPGAVPLTSTRALTNATLPYIQKIATKGLDVAMASDEALHKGLNVRDGKLCHEGVKRGLGLI